METVGSAVIVDGAWLAEVEAGEDGTWAEADRARARVRRAVLVCCIVTTEYGVVEL